MITEQIYSHGIFLLVDATKETAIDPQTKQPQRNNPRKYEKNNTSCPKSPPKFLKKIKTTILLIRTLKHIKPKKLDIL